MDFYQYFFLFDFLGKRVKSKLYHQVCEKPVIFKMKKQNNSNLLDIFILKSLEIEILNNGTDTINVP